MILFVFNALGSASCLGGLDAAITALVFEKDIEVVILNLESNSSERIKNANALEEKLKLLKDYGLTDIHIANRIDHLGLSIPTKINHITPNQYQQIAGRSKTILSF